MRISRLFLVGTVLQLGLLGLFILTARYEPSGLAKSVVIVLSFFAMSALLAHAASVATLRVLVWICLLLAIGYVLAFHALGLLFFPSLLKDVDGWSMHYLLSVLRVTAVLFAAYLSLALVLRLARVRRVVEVVPWRVVVTLLMLVGAIVIAITAGRHAGHSNLDSHWRSEGETSWSGGMDSMDTGRRPVIHGGVPCDETFSLKDGLPLRISCARVPAPAEVLRHPSAPRASANRISASRSAAGPAAARSLNTR